MYKKKKTLRASFFMPDRNRIYDGFLGILLFLSACNYIYTPECQGLSSLRWQR